MPLFCVFVSVCERVWDFVPLCVCVWCVGGCGCIRVCFCVRVWVVFGCVMYTCTPPVGPRPDSHRQLGSAHVFGGMRGASGVGGMDWGGGRGVGGWVGGRAGGWVGRWGLKLYNRVWVYPLLSWL